MSAGLCGNCAVPFLPPSAEDCREQCPECGELGACEECLAGYCDDCMEPEDVRQTRETGAWCWVRRCCCGGIR